MDVSYRRELNRTQLIFEAAGIREKRLSDLYA